MIKRRSDLFRRYAYVVDMCEAANISPCAKINGDIIYWPSFNTDSKYELPLAIVEDKPVFAGDVLYYLDAKFTVDHVFLDLDRIKGVDGSVFELSKCTWTKQDSFAELLQAQAEGQRVVFYDGAKWVDTNGIDTVNFKPESYKVVDKDEVTERCELIPFDCFKQVIVQWKKCGITGKISAEVIE